MNGLQAKLAVIGWGRRRRFFGGLLSVSGQSRGSPMEGSILACWEETRGRGMGTLKLSGVGFSAQQPIYGGPLQLVLADSRRMGEYRYVRTDPTMAFVWLVGFFGFWMPSLDDFIFFSFFPFKAATDHFRKEFPDVVESARAQTAIASSTSNLSC